MITIRKYYQPIQPTVSQNGGEVSYQELPPTPLLQHYIYCYWRLKTNQKLADSFIYQVVADGCVDILLELSQPNASYLVGFSPHYTEFPIGKQFDYIGIRFLPTAFTRLFNIKASEISNSFLALDLVLPQTAKFIAQQAHPYLNLLQLSALFNQHFLMRTIRDDTPDSRFLTAFDLILQQRGNLSLQNDLDVGVSSRQLRRLFDFYVGSNVKTISKIVRFQNLLKAAYQTNNWQKQKIYYDLGYYDQAHFIREFKQLFGKTPAKAFR